MYETKYGVQESRKVQTIAVAIFMDLLRARRNTTPLWGLNAPVLCKVRVEMAEVPVALLHRRPTCVVRIPQLPFTLPVHSVSVGVYVELRSDACSALRSLRAAHGTIDTHTYISQPTERSTQQRIV